MLVHFYLEIVFFPLTHASQLFETTPCALLCIFTLCSPPACGYTSLKALVSLPMCQSNHFIWNTSVQSGNRHCYYYHWDIRCNKGLTNAGGIRQWPVTQWSFRVAETFRMYERKKTIYICVFSSILKCFSLTLAWQLPSEGLPCRQTCNRYASYS